MDSYKPGSPEHAGPTEALTNLSAMTEKLQLRGYTAGAQVEGPGTLAEIKSQAGPQAANMRL